MKHFTKESLQELYTGKYHDYMDFYKKMIIPRLPKSFTKEYEKQHLMHDWFFEEVLVANSGKIVKEYSRNRKETVQLCFYSGDEKHILFVYKNVDWLEISFETTDDVSRISYNGFGCCISNRFDIADEKSLWHGFLFEGGVIELRFEKISLYNLRNPL